jgi:hypothetical protein
MPGLWERKMTVSRAMSKAGKVNSAMTGREEFSGPPDLRPRQKQKEWRIR